MATAMRETMWRQPADLRGLAADAAAVDPAAERLRGQRVAVVGTGTSWHAANHALWFLRAAGVDAVAHQGMDAALWPGLIGDGEAVLLLSHRNSKRYTSEARDALRARGVDVVVVGGVGSEGVDVEIIERHHRFKEDSPSGTALKFGEIIAGEMGQQRHVHGREGRVGQRPQDEIGYHALRTGDHVGEHTIVFGMIGETIDLTVRGQTRDSYAYGALAAARFLAGKPAGMYTMNDVLGL